MGGAVLAGLSTARAQIATLDKGHSLFLNNGLGVWGFDSDPSYSFNYNVATGANLNGVVFGFGGTVTSALAPGDKWGKWTDWHYNGTTVTPQTALTADEQAHKNDLIAIQVGDESNQTDMETGSMTKNWFLAAGNGTPSTSDDVYPNTLLYTNSFYINSDADYANFISSANPDAISWDSYPFSNPAGYYITPTNWLSLAGRFRKHGLGSYIGATGASPRPYGMYVQTYHDTYAVDPGDAQMRWQQFTAWTMGYSWVDAFIFDGGNTNFYSQGTLYNQFKETARQGRNLGPALTHLISYGLNTSIVTGKNSDGSGRGVPGGWQAFSQNDAPPNQRYLTGVSQRSLSYKNGSDPSNPDGKGGFYGYPGDIYIGFFNPLQASYGDPAGTAYFMVTNGLGGDLTLSNGSSDNQALVTDCQQQVTLNFDFASSGITSLERLRRSDGKVEVVPLTHLSGSQYQLIFTLDGGTGDLFKYNDGTPFVGVEMPTLLYWDPDGSATGNDLSTGANMGGSGTWDPTGGTEWHNGLTNGAWSSDKDAIFWGSAGTVTISAPVSAKSLSFRTDGYLLTGSTLTLTGPTSMVGVTAPVSVDAGVTATIASVLAGTAGLVKNGPGTLNLTNANTYSGGTVINAGVLGIGSASLGAVPSSPQTNITINNGATLRFNVNNLTLATNRQVSLGAGGGVIDTNGHNDTIAGAISGSSLTKTGDGLLVLSNGANTHSDTTVTGGVLQVSSDGALGADPGTVTTNITLDGGTLEWGASFDISNNRGISLGAGGGTLDTQGFTNTNGYSAANGFRGTGDLVKIGSGTFFSSASVINTQWTGNLIIKHGTWEVNSTAGLPVNPTTGGLRAGQVTLDGGTLQFNASRFASEPNRGITVNSGGGTIDTGIYGVTWAGPITGNGGTLTKSGSGLLRLNTSATAAAYVGSVNVAGGTLQLDGGAALGDAASVIVQNVSGATLTVTGNETIGSLSGGGANGGNASIDGFTLTIGGNNQSTTFGGVISGSSGSLQKTGSGTMVLTGENTYTAGTTISAGTLQIGTGGASGSIVGNISNNRVLRFNRSGVVTFGGNISGSGSLTQAGPGTLALTGNNTYTGSTTITGGTLAVGSNSLGTGGNVSLMGGTLQTIAPVSSSQNISISIGGGTIDSNGFDSTWGNVTGLNFTKNGAGAVTLKSLVAQKLVVNAGTIAVQSRAQSGMNQPVRLQTLSIASSAALDLKDQDLVVNGGDFSALQALVFAGYRQSADSSATGIISSTGQTAVGNPILALFDNALVHSSDYPFGSGVTISPNAIVGKYTYLGDTNWDGQVTPDDYGALDANLGTTNVPAGLAWFTGDTNFDGMVTPDDYGALDANLGLGVGNPLSANGLPAVPEPGAMSLLTLSGACWIGRRRRRINLRFAE